MAAASLALEPKKFLVSPAFRAARLEVMFRRRELLHDRCSRVPSARWGLMTCGAVLIRNEDSSNLASFLKDLLICSPGRPPSEPLAPVIGLPKVFRNIFGGALLDEGAIVLINVFLRVLMPAF